MIALTGATGFLGRYLVRELAGHGETLRCWHRPHSDRSGFDEVAAKIQWVPGSLGDDDATRELVRGCQAVVHAGLYHPGRLFRGELGDVVTFAERNIIGTLKLIEAARAAGVGRFVFISSCAVHDKILDDRQLDETHPLWATSHYGAHKAAIEKFVHSYGLGDGYPICALRPTGIYGVAHPPSESKWYELVQQVAAGRPVVCRRGGKEVHAADVARAVWLLLQAPTEAIRGEAFNCCDRYISEWDVAHLARELSGAQGPIEGEQTAPKHQIETGKLRALGMEFGGTRLLRETIAELIRCV